MKKPIKIITVLILLLAAYSLVPVCALYLQKDSVPYTNEQAVDKLRSNKGEHFGFIVFGDNHAGLIFNDSATLKIIQNINREDIFKKIPIDFVASAGDSTFRGSGWDWRIYNKIRSLIKWPVISAIGNHDDDKSDLRVFKRYVGEREFSFIDRNSYFIVLDNMVGDLTDGQFGWLEDRLKDAASYQHRFIIAHKAPLSPYQRSWYRPELSPWSYRFMKLCESYKVDIVFTGHEHLFKKERLGGVIYITTGGGGNLIHFPYSDGGFLHYIAVRVYGDYVDYEVRKIFPPFWEFITYYMWKEAYYYLKAALL